VQQALSFFPKVAALQYRLKHSYICTDDSATSTKLLR